MPFARTTDSVEKRQKIDYIKIAEAIAATKREVDSLDGLLVSGGATLAYLVGYLGSVLKLDNPRFDTAKFRKACGLES